MSAREFLEQLSRAEHLPCTSGQEGRLERRGGAGKGAAGDVSSSLSSAGRGHSHIT